MSKVITKGYTLTTGYSLVLPEYSQRFCTEFINQTTGVVSLVFGTSPVDANAILLAAGTTYVSPTPIGSEVHAKTTVGGTMIVVAAGQEV